MSSNHHHSRLAANVHAMSSLEIWPEGSNAQRLG